MKVIVELKKSEICPWICCYEDRCSKITKRNAESDCAGELNCRPKYCPLIELTRKEISEIKEGRKK